ncbi:hypothetical protein BGZ83_009872 [Gryganskiella cystojenkinii]|nr:hypothetical protein BGZ83_009872 [Gryganskiella cystojenkinii]
MAPVKTRSSMGRHHNNSSNNNSDASTNSKTTTNKKSKLHYKADPEDSQDDDDFYGMRELKHQLAGMNLCLKDTRGDGNCLFRACADQFTGTDKDHAILRQEVCSYIEQNADHFVAFLDNETVEAHVAQMRKNGTYGGNIELVAFARMKRIDVRVYQPGFIYVIEGVDVKKEGSSSGQRPVMHIAYHSWEHYSSIRNIDGPHEGLPEINPRPVQQQPLKKLTDQDPPREIEKLIMRISGVKDLAKVRQVMEKHQGDQNEIYNELAEWNYQQNAESGAEDDDETHGNSKTADTSTTLQEEFKSTDREQQQQSRIPGQYPTTPPDSSNKGGVEEKISTVTTSMSALTSAPASPGADADDEGSNGPDVSDGEGQDSPKIPWSPVPDRQSEVKKTAASTMQTKDNTESEQKLVDMSTSNISPKKRMSSREKKELAKRNQKLNRKNRDKDKAGASSSIPAPNSSSSSTLSSAASSSSSSDTPVSSKSKTMRELFV